MESMDLEKITRNYDLQHNIISCATYAMEEVQCSYTVMNHINRSGGKRILKMELRTTERNLTSIMMAKMLHLTQQVARY